MGDVNLQELKGIVVLAGENVTKWQAQCLAAEPARRAGNDEPLALAARGCNTAVELEKRLSNVLGKASGWPDWKGFGIFKPVVIADPPAHAVCVQEGCGRPQHARGLCSSCYRGVRQKRKPKRPCTGGRKNHAYNLNHICVHCGSGRAG